MHRIAQRMQRVREMAGDRLTFGEVNLHLHNLAFGDRLAHQVIAAAGVPFHGVRVRVVGGLPIAVLLELQALLVGFLALLHILFARRRGKLLFERRIGILRRCRILRLWRRGGRFSAGLRDGVQRRYRQGRHHRKKQGSRERQGQIPRTRPGFRAASWAGVGMVQRSHSVIKMLFYRET